jgi:hypothetical protein
MRRSAVILGLAALALGLLPGSARADASLELAERYAPVLRVVAQSEPCAHGEPYVPTDVNLLLGNDEVALRGPWDKTNIVKVAPTAADLSSGLFDYHLDFPGDALSPGCVYDQWSRRINEGSAPRTYARVVGEPGQPSRLALQYWFFYVFNDFNDKHEGDWEMVQLDFDASTPEEALRIRPALVGYSQHEGAESARWGEEKLQLVDRTHPVVYPALGSHANYYTSGLFLGRSAAEGVGCDDTSGPSTELRPSVSLVPADMGNAPQAFPWLGYEGRWGEEHRGFYNGPTGPATKTQWTTPLTWADQEWRSKSFAVPAGTALGTTATSFFCSAVETGSNLLTSLVGNPSPLLITLAALLALLLWLGSRTRWRPSAPLRLRRRRSWGSVVTAGRRMYLGHKRLFLGIGLLFFPLGALISALQYLLFEASGFDALVESAGRTNAAVDFVALALGLLLTVFGLSVVQSATAIAMVEIDAGRSVTVLGAYKKALPMVRSLLGTVLVAAVVIALAGLTAVGLVVSAWLLVRWAFLAQVVVLEGDSGRLALARSARLVRGDWWRVASLLLFVAGVALLLGPVVGTLLLLASSASFDFINLVSSVVYAVVLPYVAIATTYLYFDLSLAEELGGEEDDSRAVLPEETTMRRAEPG